MKKLYSKITHVTDHSLINYPILNDLIIYSDNYRKKGLERTITVSTDVASRYVGNLYGLFSEMGLDENIHMLTAAFNDINNPHDYDGNRFMFYVPIEDIYTKVGNVIN